MVEGYEGKTLKFTHSEAIVRRHDPEIFTECTDWVVGRLPENEFSCCDIYNRTSVEHY